ncbi:hypothetical protein D1872_321760 [compost metagenome]
MNEYTHILTRCERLLLQRAIGNQTLALDLDLNHPFTPAKMKLVNRTFFCRGAQSELMIQPHLDILGTN